MTTPCPCGRASTNAPAQTKAAKLAKPQPLLFAACCGRYLNDFPATPATDAESLMRSRYSAFVLGRLD